MPSTIEKMAEDYLDQIRKIQPEGPYNIIGWSFGGHVAYMVAHHLSKQGNRENNVFLLDIYPPEKTSPTPEEIEVQLMDLENKMASESGNIWPVMRHNFSLHQKHIPPQLDSDITLFVATRSAKSHAAKNWHSLIKGDISIHEIDCEHDKMLAPGPIESIGKIINSSLSKFDLN
jgi:thioesterase domain-containing protein